MKRRVLAPIGHGIAAHGGRNEQGPEPVPVGARKAQGRGDSSDGARMVPPGDSTLTQDGVRFSGAPSISIITQNQALVSFQEVVPPNHV
jgi:hypothetical protein